MVPTIIAYVLRLFRPIGLQYSWEITGQSPARVKPVKLYKRGLGMASSIKLQPDPDDLEDFAFQH